MAVDRPTSRTTGKQIGNRVREVSNPGLEILSHINPIPEPIFLKNFLSRDKFCSFVFNPDTKKIEHETEGELTTEAIQQLSTERERIIVAMIDCRKDKTINQVSVKPVHILMRNEKLSTKNRQLDTHNAEMMNKTHAINTLKFDVQRDTFTDEVIENFREQTKNLSVNYG